MIASPDDSPPSIPPPGSTQTGTSLRCTRSTFLRSGEKIAPATLFGCVLIMCMSLLTGCYKNYLYVQQEWVDANFLASSKVQTPDPRQEHPPKGQRLIIAWDFPKSLFQENLTMVATVRLWDNTQTVYRQVLERKRDIKALFFANDDAGIDRRILTYRVQIFNARGCEVGKWEHHFWTELIAIGEESSSSASRMSDSVSSHPMQESVIETP